PGDAAIVVGGGISRIEPDRLTVIGNGEIGGAGAAARERAVEVGGGVIGRQPDRLVVIGDGAGGVAFLVIGVAARHEGSRVGWVELDGVVEIRNGAVEVALGQQRAGAISEARGEFGSRPMARAKSCSAPVRFPCARSATPRLL